MFLDGAWFCYGDWAPGFSSIWFCPTNKSSLHELAVPCCAHGTKHLGSSTDIAIHRNRNLGKFIFLVQYDIINAYLHKIILDHYPGRHCPLLFFSPQWLSTRRSASCLAAERASLLMIPWGGSIPSPMRPWKPIPWNVRRWEKMIKCLGVERGPCNESWKDERTFGIWAESCEKTILTA